MSDRPAPLVGADVDLRDFAFMPLDVRTLLLSDTWIEASDDPRLGHALMSLWCESWHQVPAGSLPSSDRVLCRLSMCPTPKEWERIRERALDGFVLCSDGRLYHPFVCEKAAEAWQKRHSASRKGKAGAAARWAREQSQSNSRRNASANGTSNAPAIAQALPTLMPVDGKRQGQGESNNQEGGSLGVGVDPSPAHVRADVRTHASASERAREGVGHG